MTSATTILFKPLQSIKPNCYKSTVFSKKSSDPFLSLPCKPIGFILNSHPKHKILQVPLVAQTSDWAQQEETDEGEEEEDGSVEGGVVEDSDEDSSVQVTQPPEEVKIFVGNLPYDFRSEQLAELFNQAGVVETAEVIYQRGSETSRGFGFVTMSNIEETEKAVEMFNSYDLNGRLLTVNIAAPRGSQVERRPRAFGPSFRIYVGNLPWQVDSVRLEEEFSQHGQVVEARVIFDRETGRSRGFGFVTMASEAEMNDAIAALDGQSLDGREIRVNAAQERPRRSSF